MSTGVVEPVANISVNELEMRMPGRNVRPAPVDREIGDIESRISARGRQETGHRRSRAADSTADIENYIIRIEISKFPAKRQIVLTESLE